MQLFQYMQRHLQKQAYAQTVVPVQAMHALPLARRLRFLSAAVDPQDIYTRLRHRRIYNCTQTSSVLHSALSSCVKACQLSFVQSPLHIQHTSSLQHIEGYHGVVVHND